MLCEQFTDKKALLHGHTKALSNIKPHSFGWSCENASPSFEGFGRAYWVVGYFNHLFSYFKTRFLDSTRVGIQELLKKHETKGKNAEENIGKTFRYEFNPYKGTNI